MIRFQDKGHLYTDRNGESYTSVTTLIHKYVPPFDTMYWSMYKAIKDVMEDEEIWYGFKIKAGGWNNVVPFYKANKWSVDKSTVERIRRRQDWYITKWANERDEACEMGTAVHKELEDAVVGAGAIKTKANVPLNVHMAEIGSYASVPLEDGIYVEQMLWLEEFRLAGTADRVEIYGDDIWVHDYKTNKKIDFQAFRNEKLYAPLNSLKNCNFDIYTMQLSTYGYMLEELTGKKVKGLYLYHVREDMEYVVPYRRNLVKRMLKDYATSYGKSKG